MTLRPREAQIGDNVHCVGLTLPLDVILKAFRVRAKIDL